MGTVQLPATTAIATAVQNLVDQTAAGLASGHDACGNPLRRNVRIIGGDKVTVRVRDTEVGTVVTVELGAFGTEPLTVAEAVRRLAAA